MHPIDHRWNANFDVLFCKKIAQMEYGTSSYIASTPLQMVWSKACEVGCAIAECSGLQRHFQRFYGRGHPSDYDGPLYLLVCIYGAGYPENTEDMFYFKHPYRAGPPCRDCPPLYPLCQPNPFVSPEVHGDNEFEVQGDSTTLFGGLCCKLT